MDNTPIKASSGIQITANAVHSAEVYPLLPFALPQENAHPVTKYSAPIGNSNSSISYPTDNSVCIAETKATFEGDFLEEEFASLAVEIDSFSDMMLASGFTVPEVGFSNLPEKNTNNELLPLAADVNSLRFDMLIAGCTVSDVCDGEVPQAESTRPPSPVPKIPVEPHTNRPVSATECKEFVPEQQQATDAPVQSCPASSRSFAIDIDAAIERYCALKNVVETPEKGHIRNDFSPEIDQNDAESLHSNDNDEELEEESSIYVSPIRNLRDYGKSEDSSFFTVIEQVEPEKLCHAGTLPPISVLEQDAQKPYNVGSLPPVSVLEDDDGETTETRADQDGENGCPAPAPRTRLRTAWQASEPLTKAEIKAAFARLEAYHEKNASIEQACSFTKPKGETKDQETAPEVLKNRPMNTAISHDDMSSTNMPLRLSFFSPQKMKMHESSENDSLAAFTSSGVASYEQVSPKENSRCRLWRFPPCVLFKDKFSATESVSDTLSDGGCSSSSDLSHTEVEESVATLQDTDTSKYFETSIPEQKLVCLVQASENDFECCSEISDSELLPIRDIAAMCPEPELSDASSDSEPEWARAGLARRAVERTAERAKGIPGYSVLNSPEGKLVDAAIARYRALNLQHAHLKAKAAATKPWVHEYVGANERCESSEPNTDSSADLDQELCPVLASSIDSTGTPFTLSAAPTGDESSTQVSSSTTDWIPDGSPDSPASLENLSMALDQRLQNDSACTDSTTKQDCDHLRGILKKKKSEESLFSVVEKPHKNVNWACTLVKTKEFTALDEVKEKEKEKEVVAVQKPLQGLAGLCAFFNRNKKSKVSRPHRHSTAMVKYFAKDRFFIWLKSKVRFRRRRNRKMTQRHTEEDEESVTGQSQCDAHETCLELMPTILEGKAYPPGRIHDWAHIYFADDDRKGSSPVEKCERIDGDNDEKDNDDSNSRVGHEYYFLPIRDLFAVAKTRTKRNISLKYAKHAATRQKQHDARAEGRSIVLKELGHVFNDDDDYDDGIAHWSLLSIESICANVLPDYADLGQNRLWFSNEKNIVGNVDRWKHCKI